MNGRARVLLKAVTDVSHVQTSSLVTFGFIQDRNLSSVAFACDPSVVPIISPLTYELIQVSSVHVLLPAFLLPFQSDPLLEEE